MRPATLHVRRATRDDLPAMIALLGDDELGTRREADPLDPRYAAAFEAISADPHQHLLVATIDRVVVGMLQLTRTPGLSRAGAWRATLEAVRVRRDLRGKGHGATLVREALALARAHGCHVAQLTSDLRRTEARRFYERLGFVASHVGFKLDLSRE